MAQLVALTRSCGQAPIKGVQTKMYTIPYSELSGWPQTKAELGGTDQGDTKVLGEAFAFVATTGLGYWREVTILVDTGQFTNTLEGDIGGQEFQNRFQFFILGNGPKEREFVDCLNAYNGCLINLIPSKDGQTHVQGDPDNGVFVESIEGGTGPDRVGYLVTLYSSTGFTNMSYDATLGINTTPNA